MQDQPFPTWAHFLLTFFPLFCPSCGTILFLGGVESITITSDQIVLHCQHKKKRDERIKRKKKHARANELYDKRSDTFMGISSICVL